MKIVFYSPYLPKHFGGGEKYLFDVALTYAQKHQVYIALPASAAKQNLATVKAKYQDFLGRNLDALVFIVSPLGGHGNRLKKIFWTSKFDVIYYVTDGSVFFSLADRNIMHIQVPLKIEKKNWWEKMKLNNFKIINTNSQFTKKVVEKFWGVKVNLVCQPGVDTTLFHPPANFVKEKIILNVGRFFDNLHCKNQDVLVEFFKKSLTDYPEVMAGWKLVLIGKVESEMYVNKVRKLARGLPVEILTEVDHQELIHYYQRAAIYWHATGFFADEWQQPEKMEHFGISTVEAMAAGCAPVVIAKGGQKEILGEELAKWSWLTENECVQKTVRLLKNPSLLASVGAQAMTRAEKYSLKNFEKKCWSMLK